MLYNINIIMCYSSNLSLMSFTFGITTSMILINYGNKSSNNTNKAIGYLFFFVSFMQFVEYLAWSDIKCSSGLNKISAYLGAFINNIQPVLIFILVSYYLESKNIIPYKILLITNILYLIYFVYKYYIYISNNNLCLQPNEDGHLVWSWIVNFNYTFYYGLILLNVINYYNNKNLIASLIVTFLLLFISIYQFNKNIGELWCLMVTGVPLVALFMQKILNINN